MEKLAEAAKPGVADASTVRDLASAWASMSVAHDVHSHHEDDVIFPALEALFPGTVCRLTVLAAVCCFTENVIEGIDLEGVVTFLLSTRICVPCGLNVSRKAEGRGVQFLVIVSYSARSTLGKCDKMQRSDRNISHKITSPVLLPAKSSACKSTSNVLGVFASLALSLSPF